MTFRVAIIVLHTAAAALATLTSVSPAPAAERHWRAALRSAVARSLPPLQEGARTFRERSEGRCISCHHQGLVLPAVALARQRGLAVNEQLRREEIDRVHGFYARRQARYTAALDNPALPNEADHFGNFTVHAGYWLWALAAEQVPRDAALETTVALLATRQWDDGRWSFTDTARAPMQSSDFTTTALAVFALEEYGAPASRGQNKERIARARTWLATTAPRTTDDLAFRLYGLSWTLATSAERERAAQELLAVQRVDGGFGQQPNMPSDAYATGLALTALRQTGALAPSSLAFRAGIEYLLATQLPDGSWLVKTRAIPTNPYFESGFPHARSQFISYAGTCWATMALCLALDN